MSTQENVQTVKDFLRQWAAAIVKPCWHWLRKILSGLCRARIGLWPAHRGHAGLTAFLQRSSESVEISYPEPPEYSAQGDRVLVVGVAEGKIKATNKAFKDDWVFDITVQNGKLKSIREYVDTQALARASDNSDVRSQNQISS